MRESRKSVPSFAAAATHCPIQAGPLLHRCGTKQKKTTHAPNTEPTATSVCPHPSSPGTYSRALFEQDFLR